MRLSLCWPVPHAALQIVGFAGYGSYLTALSYPVYLQLGGAPKGQPGYDAGMLVLRSARACMCWVQHLFACAGQQHQQQQAMLVLAGWVRTLPACMSCAQCPAEQRHELCLVSEEAQPLTSCCTLWSQTIRANELQMLPAQKL